jgi:uncharacterized YccA/Bax inhibitor family protein
MPVRGIEITMLRRSATPLKLVDLMVLTGTTAVSFALARDAQHDLRARGYPEIYRWIESSGLCVTIWMWAILGLRLHRPRPRFWRLARQPGILACCISLSSFVLSSIQAGILSYEINSRGLSGVAVELANGTCYAILIAWLTLAITGQWRPTPDWFDRAGRALGVYMLVVFCFVRILAGYLFKFL